MEWYVDNGALRALWSFKDGERTVVEPDREARIDRAVRAVLARIPDWRDKVELAAYLVDRHVVQLGAGFVADVAAEMRR